MSCSNKSKNCERKNKVQTKESGKCGISDRKATSDSVRDVLANKRNCRYKAGDNSCPSETHLPSGKNITNECGSHHQKEYDNSRDSQFGASQVGLVVEAARHVKVDQNKDRGSTVRVEVTKQVPARHICHNVFN